MTDKITTLIDDEPTIKTKKCGHWIHGHCGVDDYIKCSECFREVVQNIVTLEGDLPEDVFNLCPFCGARMKVE